MPVADPADRVHTVRHARERILLTRRLLLTLALAALVVAVLGTGAAAGATRSMGLYDGYFARSASNFSANLTIKKYDTVKWFWRDTTDDHNVRVIRKGSTYFRSKVKTSGTARKKFGRTGTFTYVCDLHEYTMVGKITVKK